MKSHERRCALVGGMIYSKGMPTSRRADVLVADGRIERILEGDEAPSRALQNGEYRVIDVAGKLVLPGFHDAHLHPTTAALALTRGCWLPVPFDGSQYLSGLQRYASLNPDMPWVSGRGWRAGPLRAAGLDRRSLDRIVPDRPVYVLSLDFHSAWVNTRALEIAGIDGSTPDPANGIIERDADGVPNGLLHESAKGLVNRLLPVASVEERKQAILWSQEFLFALGVTSWQDAWVDDATLQAYVELAREDLLVARVVAALGWDAAAGPEQVGALTAKRKAADLGQLSAPIVKIMNDGVCEVGTAALHEPYATASPDGIADGLTFNEPGKLRDTVAELAGNGFAVHFHCVGDRSASDCIDACEAASQCRAAERPPHQIAHLQIVRDADIARMARLGIAANMQPASLCADEETSALLRQLLGPERYRSQYPLAKLRDAGVHLAFSSDWGVTSADPLVQIGAACGFAQGGWARMTPGNRLSLGEAVDAYTWGAAYASGLAADRGRIAAGAIADLVILDRDIFHEDAAGSVAATMVGGRFVYARPDFFDPRMGTAPAS